MHIRPLISVALAGALLLGSAQSVLAAAVDARPHAMPTGFKAETDASCVDDVEPSLADAPELAFGSTADDEPAATAEEPADAADTGAEEAAACADADVPAFDVAVSCADLGSHPSMRVLCSLYARGWSGAASAALERAIAMHATKVAPGWTKKHSVEQVARRAEQLERRAAKQERREAARAERAAAREERAGAKEERAAAKQDRRADRELEQRAKGDARAGAKAARGDTRAAEREDRDLRSTAERDAKPDRSHAEPVAAKAGRS